MLITLKISVIMTTIVSNEYNNLCFHLSKLSTKNLNLEVRYWSDDSLPMCKITRYRVTLLNGKRHGWYERWNRQGQKVAEGLYINGKQHGPWRYWYDNGKLFSKGNYNFGKDVLNWEYF